MSFFTPADAAYLKSSVRKIIRLKEGYPARNNADPQEAEAELARLEAFIDGCTLEKGKGSE